MPSEKYHKGNYLKRYYVSIFNGGKIAWNTALYRLIKPFTRAIDKIQFGKAIKKDFSGARICLIVGLPRSGSTVICQAISKSIPSLPYTNLHYLFPSHGSNIFRKLTKNKNNDNDSLTNYHGYTASLIGVNEANEVLEWAKESIDLEICRKYFSLFVEKMSPKSDETIILKNIRAFDTVEKIYKSSWSYNLIIIRVRRNLQEIVESSLNVYLTTGTFHPVPDHLKKLEITDPIEFAVDQIIGIEKVLDDQLASIDAKSLYEISYEDFCANPYKAIEKLCTENLNIPKSSITKLKSVERLQISTRKKVNGHVSKKIKNLLMEKGIR